MRKVLLLVTVAAAVAALVALPAGAGAGGGKKRKSFTFTTKANGAQISATEAAYKAHDSRFGDGAGVQVVKLDKTGLAGSDHETTYYAHGSARSRGTFKLSAPDADGISQLTGSGKDIGGTGKAKGFKSTYTYKGTFNTKTLVYKVTLKGKGSLPRK